MSEISKKLTDDERKKWKEQTSLSVIGEQSSIEEHSVLDLRLTIREKERRKISLSNKLKVEKPA